MVCESIYLRCRGSAFDQRIPVNCEFLVNANKIAARIKTNGHKARWLAQQKTRTSCAGDVAIEGDKLVGSEKCANTGALAASSDSHFADALDAEPIDERAVASDEFCGAAGGGDDEKTIVAVWRRFKLLDARRLVAERVCFERLGVKLKQSAGIGCKEKNR